MKCHKCGFVSFDHLSDCRKCGVSLEGARTLLGLLDFKPTTPFFLGAMIGSKTGGANGNGSTAHSTPSDSVRFAGADLGGDLEIEIEPDLQALSDSPENHEDQDLFPHIDLPEGFSLSLGEEDKGDDFDLIIGPEFEQALAQELSDGDIGGQGELAEAGDALADLRFDEPLVDALPQDVLAEGAGGEGGLSIPDLALDLALEVDPPEQKSSPRVNALEASLPETAAADRGEDGLTIDFSHNDLNNLLLELEENPSET